jgi:hypothetical protein
MNKPADAVRRLVSCAGELQSRGLVHFSAKTLCFQAQPVSENMDLTPLRVTLQFSCFRAHGHGGMN